TPTLPMTKPPPWKCKSRGRGSDACGRWTRTLRSNPSRAVIRVLSLDTVGSGDPMTQVKGGRIGTVARIRERRPGLICSAVTPDRVSRSRARVRQGIHIDEVTPPLNTVARERVRRGVEATLGATSERAAPSAAYPEVMSVRRVMGIETEYGIAVPGDARANPMAASGEV